MSKNLCHHSLNETRARELLTEKGLNRTKTKLSILIKLAGAQGPLSVTEIHELIGAESCDISTVFRTMTQFKEKELIREINLGEDFFRYEFMFPEDRSHHHHHVRCRECGVIRPLEKCDLGVFEKLISKLGFTHMEHHLEFTGLCPKCST